MTIINIEEIKKLDIKFAGVVYSFRKKNKLTDGEIILMLSNLERAIILKTYKEIILMSCEKLIDEKNDNNNY